MDRAKILKIATELMTKAATPVLWKYQDPDGKEFYLPSRQVTIRSPYSGKSFSAKPEKSPLSEVSKDLRDDSTGK